MSAMRRIVVHLLVFSVASQAAEETPWLPRPGRTSLERKDILPREESSPQDLWGPVKDSADKSLAAGRTSWDLQGAIINGETAARGQFPWQAYIVPGSSSFCGGSLVSGSWVLTAANCVARSASYTVTLGSTSLLETQEGSVSLLSRYWIMHSGYSGVFIQNDVGLIRLPSPVVFSEYISPVRLPKHSQASETFAGRDAVVTGFGRLSSYNYTYSSTLQFARATILANDECSRYFPLDLLDSNICSVGEDSGPCDGDFGGPLVVSEDDGLFTLVGLMSFNWINCPVGAPTAYARTTSYLRWIETYSDVVVRE
ncbi:chymotrypsinogen A-like [Bacillus rossius redtenbacheri]|uniref:chymotrypsinogen A-like n=1 Tax=Bacillus rossius redtenbacheri TaxID=93214 RepID=UPI002FDEE2E9